MNIIVEKEYYTRKLVEENPQNLYIFGENEAQQGSIRIGGGQAVIRGLENTFGFCTKESIMDFWSDMNYANNINKIEEDIKSLKAKSAFYENIVFPANGLGTGLSQCPKKCPRTFLYLSRRLLEVFGYNNIENLTT